MINKNKPLLIYGAGTCGQDVAYYLMQNGYQIEAFLDRSPKVPDIAGIPVMTLEDYLRAQHGKTRQIIIAMYNPTHSIKEVIVNLKQHSFLEIITMWSYKNQFLDAKIPHPDYFLTESKIANAKKHIEKTYPLLSDQKSRDILASVFEFRSTGNYEILLDYTSDQYVPSDLSRWPQKLRYIDCGAYTGDTIRLMMKNGYAFEAIAAFEPDLTVFNKLVSLIKDKPCIAFPCGVGSENKQYNFEKSVSGGSHVSPSGKDSILIVRLDDALPNFKPNFIKMDVEGAERDALKGAGHILRACRPHMAIAIYHKSDDLWMIIDYLTELNLDYKFYIRSHLFNSYELVLYAYPST